MPMYHTVRIEPAEGGVLLTFLSMPMNPRKVFDTFTEAVAYVAAVEAAEAVRKSRRDAAFENTTIRNAINGA